MVRFLVRHLAFVDCHDPPAAPPGYQCITEGRLVGMVMMKIMVMKITSVTHSTLRIMDLYLLIQ